jgi:pimeloyl-ACP methyl ester carboxylesterase/ketosteroid isomerase-like protein
MKIKILPLMMTALICFGCAPPAEQSAPETPLVDLEAERQALMQADEALFESHEDLDDFLTFFTDDALFMPADAPLATGDSIRSTWEHLISLPGFKLEWRATGARVASDGSLGYTVGAYELTVEQAGTLMVTNGKYVTVWSKQADGAWKVQVDCFNANGPPVPAVELTKPAGDMAHVNGIELYYEIHGEGTPLILLHGGFGNSGDWENQIPVLSEHYKVIAVDSRGHGRSTMGEQPISYALMASDMVALMDDLGINKANILGWSDGGIIGLYLAINQPERLIRVIASGSNYDPSGVRPDVGEHPIMIKYFGKAMDDYKTLSPNPGMWDAFLGNISQMWATEPNFTVEQLGSITLPVLLLDGENEEFIYPEHTRELADLIPTATLTLIPDTGHFAMWEKPGEINKAVLDFLGSQ